MSRRGRSSHALHNDEEEGELNLTPYLDIITTLVIFMMFTFQVVIEFRLIDLVAPALGEGGPGSSEPVEKPIQLTLIVTEDGYRLLTDRGDLINPKEIAKRPDGSYDTAQLKRDAQMFKEKLGLGESIVLTASQDIEYAFVVEAMDAVRSNDQGWLFPDVMFAMASVGGGG